MHKAPFLGDAQPGRLYLLPDQAAARKHTRGYMGGRLRAGDIVFCRAHTGDHFYDFQLVEVAARGIQLTPAVFAASELGVLLDWVLSSQEQATLEAGQCVFTSQPYLLSQQAALASWHAEH